MSPPPDQGRRSRSPAASALPPRTKTTSGPRGTAWPAREHQVGNHHRGEGEQQDAVSMRPGSTRPVPPCTMRWRPRQLTGAGERGGPAAVLLLVDLTAGEPLGEQLLR